MITVPVELPESVFSALRFAPDEFVREMRMAAAPNAFHNFTRNIFLTGGDAQPTIRRRNQ